MTQKLQNDLGKMLWNIANELRGSMNADDFRDYMLSFLFLKYLSDNYEDAVKRELKSDYPILEDDDHRTPLSVWQEDNETYIAAFEGQMRRKVHYVIQPQYLWANISELARTQSPDLLETLEKGFRHIEQESFGRNFQGLFSEINLNSDKLGKNQKERNDKLGNIINEISKGLSAFSMDVDLLGDAYEYLIGQFAAGSGQKAGEFYTPQEISSILSGIVVLDSQDPTLGEKSKLNNIFDFACGSGSLLLNVRKKLGKNVGKIYGQEKNVTTYNLARMNMLLHGVKDTEFDIFHGDTLTNDWDLLNEMNPSKKMEFDAIVANPPFSLQWKPTDEMGQDFRFKSHGLAPKSAADFAFLLHGFHYLSSEGTMAIILPHGVLFRKGSEEAIRTKLLKDNHIDAVIGLPSNLFYSTGIPVCVLVLKKCKKNDDVLIINASEHFKKEKRQNVLREEDIEKILDTYQFRKEEDCYSRRVSFDEIEENDFNLNITRYVSTAEEEEIIDLKKVNARLKEVNQEIAKSLEEHNGYLRELGLEEIG
jgi:type I restriction enzyme M protein